MYTYNARAHTIVQRYVKFLECARDDAADRKKNLALSRCRGFWTMGQWDSGTMGRRGQQGRKTILTVSMSHGLIVVFFGRWDDGTVGRWDVAADRKKNYSHCLIVSLSWFLDDGMMGQWDYATLRPTNKLARPSALLSERTVRQGEPLRTFVRSPREKISHCLNVSWSHGLTVVVFGRWENGSMGLWE